MNRNEVGVIVTNRNGKSKVNEWWSQGHLCSWKLHAATVRQQFVKRLASFLTLFIFAEVFFHATIMQVWHTETSMSKYNLFSCHITTSEDYKSIYFLFIKRIMNAREGEKKSTYLHQRQHTRCLDNSVHLQYNVCHSTSHRLKLVHSLLRSSRSMTKKIQRNS